MRKSKDGYYLNRHSCYLLQYHLVLVTKFRHPVIIDELKDFLISYAKDYFRQKDINIVEMNTAKDHIHILFEAPPQINLATMINNFKACSSRMTRKNFDLSKWYSKPFFWSDSYFLCTVSDRNLEMVKKYIQNQEQ